MLPETTIREQPGPDIDYPATAERVPASGYRGEELALTGTRYDVKPLLVSSLLFVLLGLLLAWCPWCKKNGKD